jgi:hypothetical protein
MQQRWLVNNTDRLAPSRIDPQKFGPYWEQLTKGHWQKYWRMRRKERIAVLPVPETCGSALRQRISGNLYAYNHLLLTMKASREGVLANAWRQGSSSLSLEYNLFSSRKLPSDNFVFSYHILFVIVIVIRDSSWFVTPKTGIKYVCVASWWHCDTMPQGIPDAPCTFVACCSMPFAMVLVARSVCALDPYSSLQTPRVLE